MASAKASKRVVLANPDEPNAGEFAYTLYDRAHPLYGERDEIARIKKQLSGLRGEYVTVHLKGKRIDEDGETHYFDLQRSFTYANYRSLFGPGSAYSDIIHFVRDNHSSDEISIKSLTVEVNDED